MYTDLRHDWHSERNERKGIIFFQSSTSGLLEVRQHVGRVVLLLGRDELVGHSEQRVRKLLVNVTSHGDAPVQGLHDLHLELYHAPAIERVERAPVCERRPVRGGMGRACLAQRLPQRLKDCGGGWAGGAGHAERQ